MSLAISSTTYVYPRPSARNEGWLQKLGGVCARVGDAAASFFFPGGERGIANRACSEHIEAEISAIQNGRKTGASLGAWIYDFFANIVANFSCDSACTSRQLFRVLSACLLVPAEMAKEFVSKAEYTAAPLCIVQGLAAFLIGGKVFVDERKIGDGEGKVQTGINLLLQGVFGTAAGSIWTASIPYGATAIGQMLNTAVCPLFAVGSFVNLVFTSLRLHQVRMFEKEFVSCLQEEKGRPMNASLKAKSRANVLDLLDRSLRLSLEERKEMIAVARENKKKIEAEVRKKNPTWSGWRIRSEAATLYKLDLKARMQNALKVKKAYFERRVNSECYEVVTENLDAWKSGRKGSVTMEQAVKKIQQTIFCNKVILGVKIAILILGIAALIAFTILPIGNLAIFAVFLATGIIWMALDLRGSAYWPKIRRLLFGDVTDAAKKALGSTHAPLFRNIGARLRLWRYGDAADETRKRIEERRRTLIRQRQFIRAGGWC